MGLLVLTAAFAGPADAFLYENLGGFTFGTESSEGAGGGAGKGISFFGLVVETPPPPFIPGTQYATIGWGSQPGASFTTATDPFTLTGPPVSAARSALNFTGISGVIDPGDIVPIATLTHANREIFIPFLKSVTIDSRLRIFDPSIVLEVFTPVPITFKETPNLASEAACEAANPGTHISGTDPCSDFFLFPIGILAPLGFSSGGNSFTLFFDLIPGAGTTFDTVIADCDGVAGTELCGRIRTAENETNDITLVMGLIQNPSVPAPASLVLLGLAVTAAGAVTQLRRRKGGK
jgi:hypothetical protein